MVSKEYPRIGEKIYHAELPNGLHIYVDRRPEFQKSYAFFATNYGGMDMKFRLDGQWRDTPAGVAHFLEHKMFDTEDGNALQDLAANGASPNAFTSSALTGYYFESTEKFCDNLKILLSFVSIPWFTQESVDKEQGIIGQEIRMVEDDPQNQVFYGMLEALYAHNPVRVSIAGTVESIAATDEVGPGGTLVRQVTILVNNPGVLSETSQGTASVGGAACASGSSFTYASSSQITAKAAGDLDVLNVKEGDRVSKGQVIGVISEADLETQIENARIALENAQLSLKNAQEKLEDYTITSTIDGEVIEKNLDVGDNISGLSNSGASVTYPAIIYDRSELTFDMDVDEKDISKIQVGQKVEITAGALDDQSFTGVVDKININGTTTSGHTSYPVTVKVEGSPEALYPGMNVSAKIIVEEVGSVLALPVEAVERGNTVLVAKEGCLDENGVIKDLSAAEERQVTLGRNDDEYIEIVDGLEEGEVVLALSPQGSSLMSAMGMG